MYVSQPETVFGQICRLFKTTLATATLTPVPELQCVRVEVPHLTRGWRAGQHIRLRTVSLRRMFITDLFEAHPLTIASVAESPSGEGLVLYVKVAGDWTRRLYEASKQQQAETGEMGASMRMIIEGPYGERLRWHLTARPLTHVAIFVSFAGGPGHDVLSSFTGAFIVAGGSGITFGLSAVEEMIREAERNRAVIDLIRLVWVVQDPCKSFLS